ncbi:phage major tail protein, TP901-1 family [Virgibacillus proomii]|uniref:phage major tail protein, TP901-1 family n=1 Tax=Virgibacillus proomii TaxID=84407 RepID=UPI001C10B1A3|nr:phage major tail protein, TP901-1 family [Virgibacillus proomii]MBU5267918.1 phage major tail protein, TP901-1 family [Virgibacillus proomii]
MTDTQIKMQKGKNKILLFRLLEKQDEEAAKLVFQTEHTFSYSRELERIVTKDGSLIHVGGLESEVAIEAIQAMDDPVANMLRQSVINGQKLEIWEVAVDDELKSPDNKYPAIYAQGYLDSWEDPANAEENAAISANFTVELEPQFGEATLTDAQQAAVQYAFQDTQAESAGGEENQ